MTWSLHWRFDAINLIHIECLKENLDREKGDSPGHLHYTVYFPSHLQNPSIPLWQPSQAPRKDHSNFYPGLLKQISSGNSHSVWKNICLYMLNCLNSANHMKGCMKTSVPWPHVKFSFLLKRSQKQFARRNFQYTRCHFDSFSVHPSICYWS